MDLSLFRRWILLICYIVIFIFSDRASAEARARKSINLKDTFAATDTDGKTFRCAIVGKKVLYVIKRGKIYLPAEITIQALKVKLKDAPKSKQKAIKEKIEAQKSFVNRRNGICRSDSADEGSSSLTKLTRPLTTADIALLLKKAGLGVGPDEEALFDIGINQGVEALVDEFIRTKDEVSGLLDRVNDRLDGQIGNTTTQTPAGQKEGILDLWIHTRNPFAEKLAMVLLSIWTVSGEVISDETFRYAGWEYYTRLRSCAYGDCYLPDLAVDITKDPLMLIYLNNDLNVKGNPNENYARELMELFTLGPTNLDGVPNYTETLFGGGGDIAVAAKMLTGWEVKLNYSINRLVPQYLTSRHEPGPHTMFAGKSYSFQGENYEDLVRGIFANHPEVKNYYAKELLKIYVTPKPSNSLVRAFGAVLAANGYKLRPSLRTLFISEAFYDEVYRGTVPVDPYDFAAQSTRALRLQGAVNIGYIRAQTDKMGYQPNMPPSVFWYPQTAWNSSSLLLEKANLISIILGDSTAQNAGGWSPSDILPVGTVSTGGLIEFVTTKLYLTAPNATQIDVLLSYLTTKRQYDGSYDPFTYDNTNSTHQKTKGMGLYYLMLISPEFQHH